MKNEFEPLPPLYDHSAEHCQCVYCKDRRAKKQSTRELEEVIRELKELTRKYNIKIITAAPYRTTRGEVDRLGHALFTQSCRREKIVPMRIRVPSDDPIGCRDFVIEPIEATVNDAPLTVTPNANGRVYPRDAMRKAIVEYALKNEVEMNEQRRDRVRFWMHNGWLNRVYACPPNAKVTMLERKSFDVVPPENSTSTTYTMPPVRMWRRIAHTIRRCCMWAWPVLLGFFTGSLYGALIWLLCYMVHAICM